MSGNDASRIIIDDSQVTLQNVASLADNPRGVIYDCYFFIEQATVENQLNITSKHHLSML
jgi:hypothetical protein